MKLKKGSKAAKDYMASIRSKRGIGAVKKKAVKKIPTKGTHTDTKSHNVNIKIVSGIGALPVGMSGKFWGVPFKVHNQFNIYNEVTAVIENTNNGAIIVEIKADKPVKNLVSIFTSYIKAHGTKQYFIPDTRWKSKEGDGSYENLGVKEYKQLEKDSSKFITDLYIDVKKYNSGKTGTTAAKKDIIIKPKKTATRKAAPVKKAVPLSISLKTTKEILRADLKAQKLRLTHGYDLAKRIAGLFDTKIITDIDSLKKQYYKLAKKYHPDAGGTTAQFQELENEYSKLFKKLLSGSSLNEEQKKNEIELDENLNKVLLSVISLPNIEIELIGKWIWISGLTFPVRKELSAAGFTFSGKKKMWYFAGAESSGRGKSSIEEIRARYGSDKIKKTDFRNLNGIGTLPASKRAKLKTYLKKAIINLNKRPI